MSKTTSDQLRDLLYRRVEAAGNEAVRSDGEVAADQVETLGRLARLVEIHRAAQPERQRKRWPVAALFGGTLLVTSILLFERVKETEIELDLAVSEVSFASPKQQKLADAMELSSLGVSGLRDIQLPEDESRDAKPNKASDGEEIGLRLSVGSGGQRRGSISLAAIVLAADTRVWLRQSGPPYQYRLSLQGNPTEFRADVYGGVHIGLSGGGAQELDFAAPESVLLEPGSEDTDFDLALAGPIKGAFSSQLAANDLSLFEVDEFLDLEHTVVHRVSTVQSGTIYLVSLNDQERKLRSGEVISFEQSQGEIRTLRLQDDHIELKYHGRVRGMSTGVDEGRRSLMPSWLEWLRARHGLSLLWGTAIYLLGLIVAASRWFGRSI